MQISTDLVANLTDPGLLSVSIQIYWTYGDHKKLPASDKRTSETSLEQVQVNRPERELWTENGKILLEMKQEYRRESNIIMMRKAWDYSKSDILKAQDYSESDILKITWIQRSQYTKENDYSECDIPSTELLKSKFDNVINDHKFEVDQMGPQSRVERKSMLVA